MKKFKRETHISRVIFVACIGIHQLSTQWKRITCPAHAQKICYILQLLLIWNRWLRFIEIDSIGNICDGREKKLTSKSWALIILAEKKLNPQNIFHTINKKMEACKTNGHHSKYKNRGTPRIESTTYTQKKTTATRKIAEFYRFIYSRLWFSMSLFLYCPCPDFFSLSVCIKIMVCAYYNNLHKFPFIA